MTGPVATPVAGVVLLPEGFEQVVAEVRAGADALFDETPLTGLAGPPVISRSVVERAGYAAGFPHLLGTVHRFDGDDSAWRELRREVKAGGDWHRRQSITDVVLTPAACYHVYAAVAGSTVSSPLDYGIDAYCYRHEATSEPGRLRSFRMRERVHIGQAGDCEAWRDKWLERSADWLRSLGLDVCIEPATDPFFGRDARLLTRSQLNESLKFELTVPTGGGVRQAVGSANYHKDHMGVAFDLHDPDRRPAHSACVAFGLERVALALLSR